jgi:hypothetical protein
MAPLILKKKKKIDKLDVLAPQQKEQTRLLLRDNHAHRNVEFRVGRLQQQ